MIRWLPVKWDSLEPWIVRRQEEIFFGLFALFVLCGLSGTG